MLLFTLVMRKWLLKLEQFSMLGNIIVFLPAEEIFRYLFPVGLVLGVGIGYLGSSVTIRKHLRV